MSVRVYVELNPCMKVLSGEQSMSTKHDVAKYERYLRQIRSTLRGSLASPYPDHKRAIAIEVEIMPIELLPTILNEVVWHDDENAVGSSHTCRLGACEVYMSVPDSMHLPSMADEFVSRE